MKFLWLEQKNIYSNAKLTLMLKKDYLYSMFKVL